MTSDCACRHNGSDFSYVLRPLSVSVRVLVLRSSPGTILISRLVSRGFKFLVRVVRSMTRTLESLADGDRAG